MNEVWPRLAVSEPQKRFSHLATSPRGWVSTTAFFSSSHLLLTDGFLLFYFRLFFRDTAFREMSCVRFDRGQASLFVPTPYYLCYSKSGVVWWWSCSFFHELDSMVTVVDIRRFVSPLILVHTVRT